MRHRFIQRSARILVSAIAIGFTATVSADEIEAPKSVAEELLDILRAAGTIGEAQYLELRERARVEQERRIDAAVEAALEQAVETANLAEVSAAPVAEPDPEDWDFKWNNGFRLRRNDGAFKLKFGGRIQSDWAVIDLDDELDDHIGGEGNGTEFRRARLYFSGTLYERLIFKAQYEFANTGDGEVDFKDVFIGLKGLGPLGTVNVGQFKEPFSLQAQTSSKYITFMERGLTNAFDLARNTGFMATNTVLDKRLLWQAAATKETNNSGFGFDDDAGWNLTARLVGVLLYEDGGEKVVHLGFGYSHQFRDDFALRYRQRPESHLAERFTDTGSTIPTEDIDLINPELAVVWGPASFQAEYTHSFVQGDGTEDTSFWGTYAQVSYFLTGEHREYKLGDGRFGRVRPNANFNPAKGDWGGFEFAARFSYLDLNDEFVRGGKMWDVTAGINWYLYPNARIALNYVHADLDDRTVILDDSTTPGVGGNADLVEARFFIDF